MQPATKTPSAYDSATCLLVFCDGSVALIDEGDDCQPETFEEACQWWADLSAQRAPRALPRALVCQRRVAKLLAGFSPEAAEKLLAAAEAIEGEEWGHHWSKQSARAVA